jgi:hypothetical protein
MIVRFVKWVAEKLGIKESENNFKKVSDFENGDESFTNGTHTFNRETYYKFVQEDVIEEEYVKPPKDGRN